MGWGRLPAYFLGSHAGFRFRDRIGFHGNVADHLVIDLIFIGLLLLAFTAVVSRGMTILRGFGGIIRHGSGTLGALAIWLAHLSFGNRFRFSQFNSAPSCFLPMLLQVRGARSIATIATRQRG
uniref:Uncharacterized protein n=1 Tax=Odontella aurita TaxID=265563 RepID=A0A7S4N7A7_9STRA